jgi:hypothetical protein
MCHEQKVLFNTTDILTHILQLSGYTLWFSDSTNSSSTRRSNQKWDRATCFGMYTPWKLQRALLGGSNILGTVTWWQSYEQNTPFACSWETHQRKIHSRWHTVYCIPYKCGRNYRHKTVISQTMWHQNIKECYRNVWTDSICLWTSMNLLKWDQILQQQTEI